jgi:hypothetical protein
MLLILRRRKKRKFFSWKSLNKSFSTSVYDVEHGIEQGSQTRGPRAACGPPDALVRLVNIAKNDNIINLDQI